MKTIETTVMVNEIGQFTLQLSGEVLPGRHRVVIVIDEQVEDSFHTSESNDSTKLDIKNVETPFKRRTFPASMVGKVKILGDIVSPIVDEEDWECLK